MEKIINYFKYMYEKYKTALYSSVILTLLTHIYFFTSRFGNEDDLNFLSFTNNTLSSGRFMLGNYFTGNTITPMINFLFAIIVLAVVSIIICDLLKIKNKKSMIFISAILSTFPSLAMSFSYLYMVEVYMSALVLSTLAVYITVKFKYGFIIGGLLLSLSLGNYQSYIGIATALSTIYLIKLLIDGSNAEDVLKLFMKLLLMGIIGVVLYFVILNICLNVFNTSLSSYKGADSMGLPPINQWIFLIGRTYYHFIGYFLGISFFKSNIFYTIVKCILLLLIVIVFIRILRKNKIFKNRLEIVMLLILCALLPLAINIVDFMAYKTDLSILNIYQYSMIYILAIFLIDKFINDKHKKYNYFTVGVVFVLLFCICYQNFEITNNYYYKIEEFNDYTESFNNRLLARIENTNGYDYTMPIIITGIKNSEFYKKLYDLDPWKDIVYYDQGLWGGRYIGYADLYYLENDDKIFELINNQLGFELVQATDEQKQEIIESNDFLEMDSWPSSKAIKIIEGVLVIKL